MPFVEYGLSIKPNHAILFGQSEKSLRKKAEPSNRSYYELTFAEKKIFTPQSWELFNRPIKETVQPKSNEQKEMSRKSKSRLRNYIEWMLECSKRKKVYSIKENKAFSYKIGFMTLDIPPDLNATDKQIHYKIFKPFIRILQRDYDLAEYIWKAETQDNNSLHYHLTINVWIHHEDINKEWVRCIESTGYTFKTKDHSHATTQIKATKSIKNIAAYLVGYIVKKDTYKRKAKEWIKKHRNGDGTQCNLPDGWFIDGGDWRKRSVEIKLFDCSLNLKKSKLTFKNCFTNHLALLRAFTEIRVEETHYDYYAVWKYKRNEMYRHKIIGEIFRQHINEIRIKKKQKNEYIVESFY